MALTKIIGAGANIFLRDDATVSMPYTTMTKVKELTLSLTVPKTCVLRVSFDLCGGYDGVSDYYGYARIYRNGEAYGTLRSRLGPTWATFTEDLTFTEGDLIQLYGYSEVVDFPGAVRNFRGQASFENKFLDAAGRLSIRASDAAFQWGENYTPDTNLYRSAADVLKTDDNFDALALRIGGTSVITSARKLQNIASVLQTLTPDTAFGYSLGSTSLPWNILHSQDVQIRTVAGETNPKTRLRAGYLEFGAGGASAVDVNLYRLTTDVLMTDDHFRIADGKELRWSDVNLYRSAAGYLKTDGEFVCADVMPKTDGDWYCGTSSYGWRRLFLKSGVTDEVIRSTKSAVSPLLKSFIGTEANPRLQIDSDGKLNWGLGTAGVDTNLYRSAADQLKTDDSFDALDLDIGGTSVITSARKLQNIASVLQNLIPDATDTYTLGSSTVYWLSVYATNTWSALMRPAGGDNTGAIGLSSVRWANIYGVKLYGTVGDPNPLPTPLNGLEDLKGVKFRTNGLPIEATLPTRYIPPKEEVMKQLREEKKAEPTPEEIDATYKRLEDTVNLCHTIGWLIQCVYELNGKVEALEQKMA